MTEKCRKSLEHKQGAMEEARVKAVLPVPKTTPHSIAAERDGAARSSALTASKHSAGLFFKPRGNSAREEQSFMVIGLKSYVYYGPLQSHLGVVRNHQMSSLGD